MDNESATPPSTGSSVESASVPVQAGDTEQTVISAEQRWLGGVAGAAAAGPTSPGPGSMLWQRLFPTPGEVSSGTARGDLSPAGIELDHFIVDERIGVGGMGAVFRARDTRLRRTVALKVLSPDQSRDPAAVQRFQNEARSAAQLDHDNIARVHYVGEDRGLQFIAFEFVTGPNVRELIATRGALDPSDAVNHALQIASALMHTSSVGVVHRDIKPSNIIITPSGRAKLVDLGLARQQRPETSADLTSDGTTLGTFDYISPEQARDPRNVDVKSDIYSLGCTLYHMLTGEPPYPDGNAFQKLLDHKDKQPPDPRRLNPAVSDDLSMIVRKMMASDPKRRYATPEALIGDLMLVAGTMGLRGMSPEGLVWMSSRPAAVPFWERHVWGIATVAVLLLVVGILAIRPFDQPDSRTTDTPVLSGQPDGQPAERLPGDRTTAPDTAGGADLVADATSIPGDSRTAAGVAGNDTSEPPPIDPMPITTASPGERRLGTPYHPGPPRAAGDGGELPGLPGSLLDNPSLARLTRPESQGSPEPGATSPADPEPAPNVAPGGDVIPDPVVTPVVRTPDQPLPPPMVEVIPENGSRPKKAYPTLNAALAEIEDGSQVVLSYNGMRTEPPLRITQKNIRIRGGEGFRPGIEFRPVDQTGEGVPPRMITVTGGKVELANVDLRLVVPRELDERLVLFSLQDPDRLDISGTVITIINPDRRAAVVFEITTAPGQMRNMKKMRDNESPVEPLELVLQRSFVRGAADLVLVRNTEPAELSLNNCVVALSGSLLHVQGDTSKPAPERDRLELELNHVSCLLGENLVHIDSGDERRTLLPVLVVARNNIFSSGGDRPLVAMRGNTDPENFRRLLSWRGGTHNFYDGYRLFRWIASDPNTVDFAGWRQEFKTVGSRNDRVAWQRRSVIDAAFDYAAVRGGEFAIEVDAAPDNLPKATDGNLAGADLGQIPPLPARVIPDE